MARRKKALSTTTVDPRMLGEMAACGLTLEDIAAIVDMDRSTLLKRMEDEPEFREGWEAGKSRVKGAIVGNLRYFLRERDRTMTIFLAKTVLGLRETHRIEGSLSIEHFLRQLADEDDNDDRAALPPGE